MPQPGLSLPVAFFSFSGAWALQHPSRHSRSLGKRYDARIIRAHSLPARVWNSKPRRLFSRAFHSACSRVVLATLHICTCAVHTRSSTEVRVGRSEQMEIRGMLPGSVHLQFAHELGLGKYLLVNSAGQQCASGVRRTKAPYAGHVVAGNVKSTRSSATDGRSTWRPTGGWLQRPSQW